MLNELVMLTEPGEGGERSQLYIFNFGRKYLTKDKNHKYIKNIFLHV